MKYSFFRTMRKFFIISASFFVLILTSCKDEGDFNPSFVEDTSSSTFTDKVKIVGYVKVGDSLLADKVATGLAGVYKDSVFGLSRAAFNVQPILSSNFQTFYEDDETYITDSIVLGLQYTGGFGDSVPQTFEVYRINEELSLDETYYSNQVVSVAPSIIGTKTFKPDLLSPVIVYNPNNFGGVDTITLQPQLRIRLDNAIAEEILSKSGQSEVQSTENFIKFFNGLRVQSPNGIVPSANNQNSILYFALTAFDTKMSIYYRVINDQNDTIPELIDFPINSNSVRFNTFENDFSLGSIANVLPNPEPDSVYLYSQALGGIQSTIFFPEIANQFEGNNIVVNKAELEIPVSDGSYSKFGFANALIVATRDESGSLQFIDDFFEGENYFGGKYNSSEQSYTFNIARYIQKILNKEIKDNGLVIIISGSAVNAERAVLFGPANSTRKIKLNLYYSNT